jgi:uncharacterized membrane protein (DUF485 family)
MVRWHVDGATVIGCDGGRSAVATQLAGESGIDIGRVVQRGFETMGRQALVFVTLAVLLVGVPQFLIQYVLMRDIQANDFSIFLSPQYWLALLLVLLTGFVLQAALVRASIEDLRGNSVAVGPNLVEALKLLLPLIGLTFLTSIAIAIGVVLLFVPGIIVYIMLIVSVPVLIEERRGVIGSMSRSRELTKGSRWRIFLLLILFLIVYLVLALVAAFAGTAVIGAGNIAVGIVQAVFSSVLGMFAAAMIASLYVELRMVREGATADGLATIFA